jgi:LysM repeat protein
MFKSQTTLFLVLFLLAGTVNAQNKIHSIQKGENVYRISLKYKVSMQAIFDANPGSESLIRAGETLIIPGNSVVQPNKRNTKEGTHLVLRGQTKYGLSKQFGVSIAELEALNPHIKSGLQAGHILKIPKGGNPYQPQPNIPDGPNAHKIVKGETAYSISKTYGLKLQSLLDANPGINIYDLQIGQNLRIPSANAETDTAKTYTVKAGDTKYGLSKQFNISVAELEAANPQIVSGLQKGQIINVTNSVEITTSPNDTTLVDNIVSSEEDSYVNYVIQPKETLFSLSQKAGMSIADFVALNPQLETQVLAGTTIKMPLNSSSNNAITQETSPTEINLEEAETITNKGLLSGGDKTLRKKAAWLLPKSLIELSPLDKSHAEALEQYRGGHLAIENLKRQGYIIEEVVIDVSVKSGNNLSNELNNYDVVLLTKGVSSEQLKLNNNAIVLNLSGDEAASNALSFYPLATYEEQVATLFEHIIEKNGNLIIINDSKRIQDKDLFEKYVPSAGLIKVQSNDTFNETELIDLLKSSKLNVVVVNSDKTSVFLNATNALLKQYAKYDIQLAVLDRSLIPGSEKISDKRFRILNMIFPSMVSLENIPENSAFAKQYLSDFGSEASLISGAAYDASYDVLLRAFYKDGVQKSLNYQSANSDYLKINYGRLNNNAIRNKNISLYQYNSDIGFEKIK